MRLIAFIVGLFLALLFFWASRSHAWVGRVVHVTDGDTLVVRRGGEEVTIRLYGIDAPEKVQPYGKGARIFLSERVQGKTVRIEPRGGDRYGRVVAMVFVGNSGTSVNEELVANGYAWVYRKYCKRRECTRWTVLEAEAREAGRGLWARGNPTPPWEFRRRSGYKGPSRSYPIPPRDDAVEGTGASVCTCTRDLDCSDFPNRAAAQACFRHCFRITGRDVHGLDRDRDGIACNKF